MNGREKELGDIRNRALRGPQLFALFGRTEQASQVVEKAREFAERAAEQSREQKQNSKYRKERTQCEKNFRYCHKRPPKKTDKAKRFGVNSIA